MYARANDIMIIFTIQDCHPLAPAKHNYGSSGVQNNAGEDEEERLREILKSISNVIFRDPSSLIWVG